MALSLSYLASLLILPTQSTRAPDKITIDLSDFDLEYGTYVISAHAHNPIGFDEDSYEFYYVPAKATQLEKDEDDDAADPVINVEYDDTVEKIEIVVYDGSGNPVFDEPLVINVPAPYRAGAEEITLPFGSYGLPSGDDYKIKLIAYRQNPVYDESGNPVLDESGNPVTALSIIEAPSIFYPLHYTAPEAPAIPDTGRLLQSLNITKTDYMLTSIVVMIIATIGAIILLNRSKRKVDYRKNYVKRYDRNYTKMNICGTRKGIRKNNHK